MDWCILRCSGCKTLELAASLNEAGFEAWAPVETVVLRPRRGNKRMEVVKPLVASLVFARADRLQDLLALSHSPTLTYQTWDSDLRRMVVRGRPYFRVPPLRLVPDAQLDGLRNAERKRRPKGKPKAFAPGSMVRIIEGGFEGLRGIVDECRGDYASVTVAGWGVPVKVATWLLEQALDDAPAVHVSSCSIEQALSAKAA
jgi:transcription antitermination factor NusG